MELDETASAFVDVERGPVDGGQLAAVGDARSESEPEENEGGGGGGGAKAGANVSATSSVSVGLGSAQHGARVGSSFNRSDAANENMSEVEDGDVEVLVIPEVKPRNGCHPFNMYEFLWQDRDGIKLVVYYFVLTILAFVCLSDIGPFYTADYSWYSVEVVLSLYYSMMLTLSLLGPTIAWSAILLIYVRLPLNGFGLLYFDDTFLNGRLRGIALRAASQSGSKYIRFFVRLCSSLDEGRDGDGYNALMLAIGQHQTLAIFTLVHFGANVNFSSKDGVTPLYVACQMRRCDVLKCLIDKGACFEEPRTVSGTLLMYASYRGHIEIVIELLERGANMHRKRRMDHATALHCACRANRIQVVKKLIEYESNAVKVRGMVNAKTRKGTTPLQVCMDHGFVELGWLLCEHGAETHVMGAGAAALTKTVSLRNGRSINISRTRLGAGSFGEVLLGHYCEESEDETFEVAVKSFRDEEEFLRELKAFETLGYHENIVRYFSASTESNNSKDAYIVLEYCSGGSLYEYLAMSPDAAPLDAPLVLRWMKECAAGLLFLHESGKVHRDMKTANILIHGECGQIKLSDFGTLKAHREDYSASATNPLRPAGTLLYQAPEILDGKFTHSSDVYAMGIIMWECGSRKKPFSHLSQPLTDSKLIREVLAGSRPQGEFSIPLPDDYRNLITACWDKDRDKRPSCDELLEKLQCLESTWPRQSKNKPPYRTETFSEIETLRLIESACPHRGNDESLPICAETFSQSEDLQGGSSRRIFEEDDSRQLGNSTMEEMEEVWRQITESPLPDDSSAEERESLENYHRGLY